MIDTSNRTFVSSVLFLDIVEYSKCSVTEQMKLKQRFNTLLVEALRHVALSERIVLDTGDGAAVSFLGNPEDALFAAMGLRDGLQVEDPALQPRLAVRLGINLGPVRLIKDINGQLNIIGDGINVAQRIMSFADPGTILVSRSYYEVVSRLSDDYAQIFRDAGIRTDKHVREHAVYAIGDTGSTIPPSLSDTSGNRTEQLFLNRPERREAQPSDHVHSATLGGINKRLIMAVAGISVLMIGAALMFRSSRNAPPKPPTEIVAETPISKEKPAATPGAPKSAPSAKAEAKEAKSALPPTASATAKPSPKPAANPPPAAMATVNLTILPWGDIYVDGKKRGVSPPLKSLTLTPGTHMLVIKNADFPAHIETVDVAAGASIKIKHKF